MFQLQTLKGKIMEMLKIEVSVPKEVYELATGIAAFVVEIMREMKSNGSWSVGDDLAGLSVAAMQLLPALNGAMSIGAEMKANLSASLSAMTLGLAPIVDELAK